MRIPMAYTGVILIWSTTPLAMKWSTEEVGFLFALLSRMGIGTVIALLLCCMIKVEFPLHKKAVKTYLTSGIGAYLTMSCGYWGAQYIPSGWISVIFGLAPIFTSLMATIFLGERSVGVVKTGALLLSLTGLFVMFQHSFEMGNNVVYGIAVVVAGAGFYSMGIIVIKRINADISHVSMMTGTLVVSLTLFTLTWVIGDFRMPDSMPVRSAGAILYLGIVGSVLGFMLFYYVLKHVEATRTALITLITPGCALTLGNLLNNEPITRDIILGTALVLGGLVLFQYGAGVDFYRLRQFNQLIRNKLASMQNLKQEN